MAFAIMLIALMAFAFMVEVPSPDGFCIHAWVVKPWWLWYSCLSCLALMALVFMLGLSSPDSFWYSCLSCQALMAFVFLLELSAIMATKVMCCVWMLNARTSYNLLHVGPNNHGVLSCLLSDDRCTSFISSATDMVALGKHVSSYKQYMEKFSSHSVQACGTCHGWRRLCLLWSLGQATDPSGKVGIW